MSTHELAVIPSQLVARTPADIRALMEGVQEMKRAVLVENVDYGTIPGTQRPTLYAPGAEKMAILGGLGHKVDLIAETEMGARYRCVVTRGCAHCGGEQVVSTSEGYAGYDEDKFFQTATEVAKRAEKRERENAAKYHRNPNPHKWEHCIEYRAPWNTILQRAQKRAKVRAISWAMALDGLFDTEGDESDNDAPPAGSSTAGPPSASSEPPARNKGRGQSEQVPIEVYENEGRPFE